MKMKTYIYWCLIWLHKITLQRQRFGKGSGNPENKPRMKSLKGKGNHHENNVMKKINHFYGVMLLLLISSLFSCGLDNRKSDKETEEDIRQGGNDVDYKDAQDVGAPSMSDTTQIKKTDSTGFESKNMK